MSLAGSISQAQENPRSLEVLIKNTYLDSIVRERKRVTKRHIVIQETETLEGRNDWNVIQENNHRLQK